MSVAWILVAWVTADVPLAVFLGRFFSVCAKGGAASGGCAA